MPGLLRGVARTAVIAGTATTVSNRVSRRQANRWSQQDQQQYAQQQYAEPQYAEPPPPPPAAAAPDTITQLKELAELKEQGILTRGRIRGAKGEGPRVVTSHSRGVANSGMPDPAEDRAINRSLWTLVNEEFTDGHAVTAWAAPDITFGLFAVPERELHVLGSVTDLDVIELGCGTAYFSAWLARRGARPVAVDLTAAQLATARRCQRQFDLAFPLIEANAEDVPLADGRFDLVVSEYGASVWCDPARWLPEAARLLRPGGRLVFLTNSVIATLCVPEEEGPTQERLLRPQRGLNRVRWSGGGSSSTRATATGFASCGRMASSSTRCTSSTRRPTRMTPSTTTSRQRNGPRSGRSRISGSRTWSDLE